MFERIYKITVIAKKTRIYYEKKNNNDILISETKCIKQKEMRNHVLCFSKLGQFSDLAVW
jgi:hypothetical protein